MKLTLTAIAIAAASIVFANGATIIASGTLTTADGLRGTGEWAEGSSLTYKVTQNSPDSFRYDYSLTVSSHDISHVITQICQDWTVDRAGAQTGRYSGDDPSNPNLPSEFYGLKVEASNTLFEWFITAPTGPADGHFYAKGGLSTQDPNGSAIFASVWTTGLSSGSGYVPVPECPPTVPEPSSGILTLSALPLLFRRRRT